MNPPVSNCLTEAFLAGHGPRTARAYLQDLHALRLHAGVPTLEDLSATLLADGFHGANRLAMGFKASMRAAGLSAATINRRLSTVRGLVRVARMLGLVGWSLEVEPVRAQGFRDTRGPGLEGVRAMMAHLRGLPGPKAQRDLAIIRLLFDLGLRRSEVVGLDVADVDLERRSIRVLGKGRESRETLSLPGPTADSIRVWLGHRGREPGPLFVALDRANRGHRLTGTAVRDLVRHAGQAVGLTVRPHGLRHAAITAVLDANGGDVRAAQRFSRHKDLRTVQFYDDARRDIGGQMAALIAKEV